MRNLAQSVIRLIRIRGFYASNAFAFHSRYRLCAFPACSTLPGAVIMQYKVIPITKAVASTIAGSMSQTSKMPCQSYSLPTVACITGFKMAQIKGSICSECYADKGNYRLYANNIEPGQHARLDAVLNACNDPELAQAWIDSILTLIGSDDYFRWHDSGDLQSVEHLRLIAQVCEANPGCKHWLPTREYGMVKDYVTKYGSIPANLTIRLSAMYADKPVIIPKSLQGIAGIESSNVHSKSPAVGMVCNAPSQGGKCLDCRACWNSGVVSYAMH